MAQMGLLISENIPLAICSGVFLSVVVAAKVVTIYHYWNRVNPFDKTRLHLLQKLCYGCMSEFAEYWNGYEVHGLSKVPTDNCLLIGYHSRTTVDLLYFQSHVQGHILITHLLFYIPVLGSLLPLLGAIPSKGGIKEKAEDGFIEALSEGKRPLILLPGGSYECLKSSDKIGKVSWKKEPGFARVIVQEKEKLGKNTKIIPFYTKNCETCLWTTHWWYDWSGFTVRKLMKSVTSGNVLLLPFTMTLLLFSLGFFLLPRPVKMDTYFGDVVCLKDNETAEQFATRVGEQVNALMTKVDAMPERPYPKGKPGPIASVLYGGFTLLQNLLMHLLGGVALLFIGFPAVLLFILLKPIMKGFKGKKSKGVKKTE